MKAPALCGAALCLAAASHAAKADVLEVGRSGAVFVRASDKDVAHYDASGMPEDAPDVPAAALTMLASPAVPIAYQASLEKAAATAGISPSLLAALVWQESRWHPTAVSAKGARGLTQLMPGTARALAVDPNDANANLAGGARYLRSLLNRFDGNVERALAAYNAGPVRVLRAGGLPAIAETRAYVASIMERLDAGSAPLEGAKP
jgi:soluble lytic murein transglycosylase-like protein